MLRIFRFDCLNMYVYILISADFSKISMDCVLCGYYLVEMYSDIIEQVIVYFERFMVILLLVDQKNTGDSVHLM